jgi:CHAT domain-containing protein/tetratricopeptide (TPR) repeat protein
LTAAQRARLEERDRLAAEVDKLWNAGKKAEAIAAVKKVVAIEKELLGANHRDVIESQQQLDQLLKIVAGEHERREEFDAARKARREVLALRQALYGDKDWRVTDARFALADSERLAGFDATGRARFWEARDLSARVMDLSKKGRAREAVTSAQKMVAIHKSLLGKGHPDYATSLHNLAGLYRDMRDYPKALPLLEEARAIWKKALGPDHPDYAASLHNLALLYQDMGDYAKALPLAEEARAIARKALGADHPDYAHSLHNLAALYQAMGDYPKALPLSEEARAIFKKASGADHPDYALSLNNLASLYEATGEYQNALPLYEEALAIFKKTLGADHPAYATSLNGLALLYQALGDYAKALPLLEEARAILKKALGADHRAYATSLGNLAALYHDMGDYAKALPLLEEARAIRKKALGADHPAYATSLNGLALLYQALGDYAKALPLLEEARAIRKKALGTDHPDYATSLNNLAGLYRDMGDYPKALPLLEEARAIARKALGADHPDYAISLDNLAVLYQAMGQSGEAATLLHESLTIRRTFLDRTLTIQSDRQRLAFLAQQRRTLDAYLPVARAAGIPAGPLYEAVLAGKGALAARQAEEYAARGRPDLRPALGKLRHARAGLARLYQQQPANVEQRADWLKRFGEFEARKEKVEVELAGASATYRRFRELRAATADQVAAALPPGTALIDFVQYTHFTPPPKGEGPLQEEERLLAFVLARGKPPACVALGPAGAIEQAAQAWRRDLLQPGTDPRQTGTALAKRLWAPLAPALADATTVLIAPDGVLCGLPFAALPGTKPGTFLLEERAIGYLTSGRHLLELAADHDRPDAAGLLALGGLTYGDSQTAAAPPALPDYLTRGRGWNPLPGTRLEAERVAARFRATRPDNGEARLLAGAEPDADRLRRELQPSDTRPRWRYLHLATHGFFDPPLPGEDPARRPKDVAPTFGEQREHLTYGRNPLLRCGLVLAGANRDPEHGFLSAEEVAGLDLGGCDLAVLSACETGLGKVADGEGMLGLQRAFQAAGARSLAASLWNVSDAATSVLMEEFYANLWQQKLPKLEALRQAQLTVLRHPEKVQQRAKELQALLGRGPGKEAGDLPEGGRVAPGQPRHSPPAWWAAFILSGNTQ